MAYDRRRNSEKYTEPTIGNEKIRQIASAKACDKHGAHHGKPCWWIPAGSTAIGLYAAVCNSRARRAGFHGKISPISLNVHNRGR